MVQPRAVSIEEKDPWELESGLPNDVDAFMANCRFGFREEYKAQVVISGGEEGAGMLFLTDLVDANGEILGSQGWSVGSGFRTDDGGATLVHPVRKNVVSTSRYGQLQHRVGKELGINMKQYGLPLIAATWNGLGFHWMLEEHETLKKMQDGAREKKQGLMPTSFVGMSEKIRGGVATAEAPAKATGPAIDPVLEKKLTELAQTNAFKDFVRAAVKIQAVSGNDTLMSSVMEDGPTGFFATHQK